jgi:hypothetical protein
MRLSFHLHVQREVNEAVKWYGDEREGLGDDFFVKLSETLDQISTTRPLRFLAGLRNGSTGKIEAVPL